MEQIAASTWRDAIEDVVRAAQHDLTLNGLDANLHLPDGSQSVLPAVAPGTPGLMLPAAALGSTGSSDLPPVQSRELIASLRGEEGAESVLDSSLPSRRHSVGTMPSIAEEDGGGVASRLSSAMERAREMDRQAGLKRSAPTGVSELEGEVAGDANVPILVDDTPVPVCPPGSDDSDEALMADVAPDHPLSQLVKEVNLEKSTGKIPEVTAWLLGWSLGNASAFDLAEEGAVGHSMA